MRIVLLSLSLLLLAGCVGTKPDRYVVEPTVTPVTARNSSLTVAVAKVTLPTYAKEAGIFVQGETGALTPVPEADWADETERAMMLAIVRNLIDLTGATVAPDPWPLGGVPEAEIRVEVERMFVDRTSTMKLTGQFSIRRDQATSRNRIVPFNIQVPAASRSPVDIVAAHTDSWRELSKLIAKQL